MDATSSQPPAKLQVEADIGRHPIAHREKFVSTAGDLVLIECDCPIGCDHTYSDWLIRFTKDPR